MKNVLLVSFGGALGALFRFFVGSIVQRQNLIFPWSTLIVNAVGSFFFSFLMYSVEYGGLLNREARSFITIGVLGSFTTFSSLEYEVWKLFEIRETKLSLLNLLGNVLLGLGVILLGKILAMGIWR